MGRGAARCFSDSFADAGQSWSPPSHTDAQRKFFVDET